MWRRYDSYNPAHPETNEKMGREVESIRTEPEEWPNCFTLLDTPNLVIQAELDSRPPAIWVYWKED